MELSREFFYDEVRDGFYIPGMVKRAWGAQLRVLSEIDRICRKHNIQYFVYAGTLLGAVRDKQYIPWDDDLDTCMLRSEFQKFCKVVRDELPEELSFSTMEFNPDSCNLISAVGKAVLEMDKEKLKHYYEFPYHLAVDIFVLDDLAESSKEEVDRKELFLYLLSVSSFLLLHKDDKKGVRNHLREVERQFKMRFDPKKAKKTQIFQLMDKICQMYNGNGGDKVSFFQDQVFDEKNWYFKKDFLKEEKLSFCGIEVPVPSNYDAVLRAEFGDYQKKVKAGGDHGYPYYVENEEKLKKAVGEKWKFDYVFQVKDLERPQVENFRDLVFRMVASFQEKQQHVFQAFVRGDYRYVLSALSTAQEEAIQLGSAIEQKKGEGTESVSFLEQYCEAVYQGYQMIQDVQSTGVEGVEGLSSGLRMEIERKLKQLSYFLKKLESSLKKELKKQVVFLPCMAKHFESLRPLVDALLGMDDVEVKIIPIPYFDRFAFGEFGEEHYEGADFPEGYPITDYKTYDFASELPDCIVLNAPYDAFNPVWSVDPFFYSGKMKQFTSKLVYIPWFVTDEINIKDPNDGKAFVNMKHYVTVPGLFHADLSIVQSEEMKKTYLAKIVEFTNSQVRKQMEKKIIGAGSCLFGEKEGQGTKEVVSAFRRFLLKEE